MTVGEWYESIGMTEQDVEQAYNGDWYLKGYAPVQPLDEKEQQTFTPKIVHVDDKNRIV